MNKIRLGISLRVVETKEYREPRDTIAHDWFGFLNRLGYEWVLIPNLGEDVIDYIKKLGINAFILTGGNDIGESPVRDETETKILEYASDKRLPLIGICRGMQMIQSYFGGLLSKITDGSHIAKTHDVVFTENIKNIFSKNQKWLVNSFHGQKIDADSMSGDFIPLAHSNDGHIESFRHSVLPIYGLMWHPERMNPIRDEETKLFRSIFNGELK